jgi:hypothetical protein
MSYTTLLRAPAFAALLALGLATAPLPAQVTYTSNPGSLNSGPYLNSYVAVQTFTGFGGLDSVTWHLYSGAGSAGITAYIAEWDTLNNRTASGTLAIYGSGEQMTNTVGNVDLTFTQTLTLNPSTTYALLLAKTTDTGLSDHSVRYGTSVSNAFFSSGAFTIYNAAFAVGAPFSTFSAATSSNLADTYIFNDFALTVTATFGSVVPVPEPQSAAAALSAVFVSALFLRRRPRTA